MPRYRIRILGSFEMLADGRPIALPSKGQELIAYLSLQTSGRSTRRRLSGIMWPDLSDERASSNLSTTLWRIGKALHGLPGLPLLLVSRADIALNLPLCQVDYREFHDNCRRFQLREPDQGRLDGTIAMYEGDLLDGNRGAEWITGEQERIRLQLYRLLHLQAERQVESGDKTLAAGTYARLLAADPLDELACRGLMSLYASMGKTTDALRAYSSLRSLLKSELGAVPEQETTRLYDAIHFERTRDVSSIDGSKIALSNLRSAVVGLIGRVEEMGHLEHALELTGKGGVTVVGVEGEAGIGKTRIVEEFCRLASSKGAIVLGHACEEVHTSRPYEPFRDLVSSLHEVIASRGTARLGDSSPVPSRFALDLEPGTVNRTPDSESRVAFYEATAQWLRDLANAGPVVIALEDIQSMDSASVDLLAYLINHAKSVRLLYLLTWRSGGCPAKLEKLFRHGNALTLRLERLTRSEVRELCTGAAGLPILHRALTDFVYEKSEGNPLYALEVLRLVNAVAQRGIPASLVLNDYEQLLSAMSQINDTEVIPSSVRIVLTRRFASLPSVSKRLLRFACVAGRRLDPEVLPRASKMNSAQWLKAVRSGVRAGFVSGTNGDYAFSHEKIRAFCYEELSPPSRVRIHRVLLHVLEKWHPDRVEELAFHSARAGEVRRARRYWEAAGDHAAGMWAYKESVLSYSRAIESIGGARNYRLTPGARYRLLKKRAAAWELIGDIEQADADVGEMIDVAEVLKDEALQSESLTCRSRLLLKKGMFRQSLAVARQSLAIADRLKDLVLKARAEEVRAFAELRCGNEVDAQATLLALIPSLEKLGDNDALERVWNRVGVLQSAQGDVTALASLETAEGYWQGDLSERGSRYLQKGSIYTHMARYTEAKQSLLAAELDYRRAGNASGAALANSILAFAMACAGEIRSALLRARQGLPFRAGKTEAHWRVVAHTAICHGVLIGFGNVAFARRMTVKILHLISQGGGRGKSSVLDLAAAIALEEGNLEAAQLHMSAALEATSPYAPLRRADCLITQGRVYLASSEPHKAVEALREAVSLFDTGASHLELIHALSYLGVALNELGQSREAREESRRAVKMLADNAWFSDRPQEVLWNHFMILMDSGDPLALRSLTKAYRMVIQRAAQMGPKMRRRYVAARVNKEIVEVWGKLVGPGAQVRLSGDPITGEGLEASARRVSLVIPRTGAPWGRPLRPDDTVETILTVDSGRADARLKEQKGEVGLRRARIIRLCAEANVQGGDPREGDLARALGVSTRTIRGDVAFLRSQGCSLQTRGANLH